MIRKGNTDIDEILARYFANEADDESLEQLRLWLEESDKNQKQFDLLKSIWDERSAEPRSINTTNQDVLNNIWKKGTEQPDKGKGFNLIGFFNYLPQVAAAVLVLIIMPIAVYWITTNNQPKALPKEIVFILKENPATQRSRFMLPDGSIVWLNCKSSLRYPENFDTSTRQVELVGEAYFEIREDSLHPFIVMSENIATTALGTSFNVAAYPDKSTIEISLITGKVSVEDKNHNSERAVLNPGRGISYNKASNQLTKKKINAENILAWKSGILIFDGDNYDEFIWKIKQWYDVEITTVGNVPGNWRIRGRFDNAYLSSIMDVISFNKGFQYQLKDKQLILRFN